jgi:hypothetical protein
LLARGSGEIGLEHTRAPTQARIEARHYGRPGPSPTDPYCASSLSNE